MRALVKPVLAVFLALGPTASADDFSALCTDRAAIERIYYNHRLGTKPPFEQTLPRETLERLVRQDLHKEAVLKKVYNVEVTRAMLDAEVQRINTTTRAPEMLAELRAALGNDDQRFARTVARPIVVERLLRGRFDNDDKLHSAQRRQVEQMRDALLNAKRGGATFDELLQLLKQRHSNAVMEMTWQLARQESASRLHEVGQNREQKLHLDDLPLELQNVLRAQLRQPADVSAVIEMPGGFAVYVARERTVHLLSAATLSIPKRNFEEWLREQR
jgi:hypothetical protein